MALTNPAGELKLSIYSPPLMRPQKLIRLGITAAILSVIFGTLIFFAYYFTSANLIIYLEYIFIFLAGAVSFVLLLRIFNHITKHKRHRRSLIITSIVIALSCLVVLIYFRYLTSLMDTMRINFVNQGRYAVTNIKITGCQKKYVEKIEPKGHEMVWIKISRLCAINISYNENGATKNEVVTQFTNISEGRQLTYRIGTP